MMAFRPTDLPLPRCARHEQVGGFGEVEHEDLVRDGAPQGHGQGELGFLRELLRGDDRVHGHDLRLFVGHLYPDGAFARYGGDDADALGGQAQHDVRLQVAYLRDADARPGTISYNVMVGPTVALMEVISMP